MRKVRDAVLEVNEVDQMDGQRDCGGPSKSRHRRDHIGLYHQEKSQPDRTDSEQTVSSAQLH